MVQSKTIRIAVAQFHVGGDLDKNLQTCLRMLDKAEECNPDLIVLPEFCNHLSWYDDKEHSYQVSVSLESDFLKAISEKAAQLACYVVVNCTVQREGRQATGSSLLYSPDGELIADNTKQIYIGHENDFLEKALETGPVIDTSVGRVGLYACMDGVINETPRCLALRGADLMLNSLNSFATDEASLHIPVRAAENKVFVVAANKIGPLVPEEMVDAISAGTGIPVKFLDGAGESQIVAPDGKVLVKASRDKEEVVYADIDVSEAFDKRRPDGTDIFDSRRPELYTAIAENPVNQPLPTMQGASSMQAAVVQLEQENSLAEALSEITTAIADGAELVALAPMVDANLAPEDAALLSKDIVTALTAVCEGAYVSTALVFSCDGGYQYCAVLIGGEGVVLKQAQIHPSKRNHWSVLTDTVVTAELAFGRVALVCSDDSIYPETFRLLAMAGVEIAAVALSPLETWELATGLLERSAENRINLLVATQPSELGASFATALQTDFTVLTEWRERPFDGLLSQPIWYRFEATAGIYPATLHPGNAANKVVSRNTDLLSDRPWQLSSAIAGCQEHKV